MEHGKHFDTAQSPLLDFESVCQNVCAAMEPARTHAISLHDRKGEVLWLSESSMGPDEHNAVREALESFSEINTPPVLAFDLGDARSAVLLRAIDSRRTLAGVVMVIMDTRVIAQDRRGPVALMTPRLQRALANFADMRPGLAQEAVPTTAPAPAPVPPPSMAPAMAGTAGKRPVPVVTPEVDRLHAALRRSPIGLHVQRLVPLGKGDQLQRYEVLLRSTSEDAPNAAPHAMLKAAVDNGLGSMIDRRVVGELIAWLLRHPDVWRSQPVLFSVNLTSTALHDEHFIKFVGLCLAKAALPKGMIAFEIDVPTAVRLNHRIADIADALNRLGCPLVLDDFGLRTECFDLLRLSGVRYIKLAPQITANMRTDRISQAAITAVVQMARVLAMHTVAKRTETPAEQEWLTALGVDFVQSNGAAPAVAIDTLSKAAKLKA
jgi:EAL domain-containing protein (putative c-di-GMP-specific phosphodiesterase class I)